MRTQSLVLNASFEPLNIVSWQRGIQLLFQGKVEVIEESDEEIRSVSITMKIPSVLRLIEYVPLKRKTHTVRFSRENIFLRDSYKCGYCQKKFTKKYLTLDHVVPVVQNGRKTWENIVTSCMTCNQKKGGRTPREARMKLHITPREPKWLPATTLQLGISFTPKKWKIYLK
ncbi:MAG: HNH endonuclease [Bdellovibrionaceae bacterium]|nr:HNH endonuclease [Pseudobdellovibrionaceae bacterium]|tara:strand:- start:3477 stop:3989 length:513 start_codon:yes stop_codon:yes gene_type:complete